MSIPTQRLCPQEAAQYLGISASTLAKMRVYGGSPRYAKIGRRVVFDTADLDTWLAAHKCRSTSEYDREEVHHARKDT